MGIILFSQILIRDLWNACGWCQNENVLKMHGVGTYVRNANDTITYVIRFSRVAEKFSKAYFQQELSARFQVAIKQWNWMINVVPCTCTEPWNPAFEKYLSLNIHRLGLWRSDSISGEGKAQKGIDEFYVCMEIFLSIAHTFFYKLCVTTYYFNTCNLCTTFLDLLYWQ